MRQRLHGWAASDCRKNTEGIKRLKGRLLPCPASSSPSESGYKRQGLRDSSWICTEMKSLSRRPSTAAEICVQTQSRRGLGHSHVAIFAIFLKQTPATNSPELPQYLSTVPYIGGYGVQRGATRCKKGGPLVANFGDCRQEVAPPTLSKWCCNSLKLPQALCPTLVPPPLLCSPSILEKTPFVGGLC